MTWIRCALLLSLFSTVHAFAPIPSALRAKATKPEICARTGGRIALRVRVQRDDSKKTELSIKDLVDDMGANSKKAVEGAESAFFEVESETHRKILEVESAAETAFRRFDAFRMHVAKVAEEEIAATNDAMHAFERFDNFLKSDKSNDKSNDNNE